MESLYLNSHRKNINKQRLLFILILSVLIFAVFSYLSIAKQEEPIYFAPAKEYTPEIYKYISIFTVDNKSTKHVKQSDKKGSAESILSDSIDNIDNKVDIRYNDFGEPIKLKVTVKDKDKKINITLYNLLGKKVADIFDSAPGANKIEIDSFTNEVNKLSNGIYICVMQGFNYRIMEKFTISR